MENQNLNKFIVGIIIVGLTLVLGIYIAATMQTTMRAPGTIGIITGALYTPSDAGQHLDVWGYTDVVCTITSANNATAGGVLIEPGNYTQSPTCNLINLTSTYSYPNYGWVINYTYSYSADTVSSNSAGSLVTALSGGTAWIIIIVVVGFAVIVLGMLTSGLGRTGQPGTYEQQGPIY